MARRRPWDGRAVDVLLLGDSAVVALTRTGEVLQVRGDRLRRVATDQRAQNVMVGFGSGQRDEWRQLVDAERAHRNRPDGYWIAEAVPEAAGHAVRWPRSKRHDDKAIAVIDVDGA
jgi:hypothetical protein